MYRFTDGKVHDINIFENVYTNLKISDSNYSKEKQKGLFKIGDFVYPKDLEMIKFRYYTDDGQLIEQENVPVVYDGSGIESEVVYYALSTNQTAPNDSAFSTTIPTMTATNKYLWSYTFTTYDNKTTSRTEKVIIGTYGDKGENGEQGATYLGCFASAPTSNIHNQDYYLNKNDGFIYVYAKGFNIWNKLDSYSDTRYQTAMNDMIGMTNSSSSQAFMSVVNAWVKNLTAQTALINELFAKQISLRENGFIQSKNFNDNTKNGFKIKANGDAIFRGMEATNVNISGNINATSGNISDEVSIGGYINQSIPRSVLCALSFWYGNSFSSPSSGREPVIVGSLNIRTATLDSNYYEIKRIAKGRYIMYFHLDWIENLSPVKNLVKKYPFNEGKYSYIIRPIKFYAGDISSIRDNGRLLVTNSKFNLNIITHNTYYSAAGEEVPFVWEDGYWNDGFSYGLSPNGVRSYEIEIDFLDFNNDGFIDPIGGASFALELWCVPNGYKF